jgi:glycine cleavage system transcriptional repressor
MKAYLLLTAVGPDRPGLVDEVSAFLAERGINIEASRMAVLGGEFAMIMLASGAAAEVDRAVAYPMELARNTGLQLWVKRTAAPEARVAPASLPYRIVTAGMDHPGIVHDISKVIHSFSANIESMDTRVTAAPVSGTPMFSMEAVISVPAEVKVKKMKEALEKLGDELNMDIEFEPIEAA